MSCGDEKLSKYLTQTFTAHCNAMICQQVTLLGDAEWPKVADAVIEAELSIVIVLIPHIVTEREIHTLGSLCNAENRLSLLQGKRDFRHPRLLWRLSPEAL